MVNQGPARRHGFRAHAGRARLLGLGLVVLALATAAPPSRAQQASSEPEAENARPAVLLVVPKTLGHRLVDYEYLAELHEAGFEPDYLDDPSALTWQRLRHYNVLVFFGVLENKGARALPLGRRHAALIERFLEAGGGVFGMIYTHNADDGLRHLLEPWGARLPLERYVEEDPQRVAPLPRMGGRGELTFLDEIAESPISRGVEQLWWPYGTKYNTSMTAPIHVSEDWQVVVRGSPTSRTEPVTPENSGRYQEPPRDPLVRQGGVPRPPLLAIREYRQGRLLLTAQYPQHSIGQGTRWLFDRRALSKGLREEPSHWGRMIRNALHWLAEPSLPQAELGGYDVDPDRLIPPNERPGAKAELERRFFRDPARLPTPAPGRIYRGMLGAQTTLSTGTSTVQEYAEAAREAGLDFLVFMEDFTELTEQELRQLDSLCKAHSSDDLLLLPGYTIDNNIGNHLFFYGYGLPWPPDFAIHRGDDGRPLLNQQMQDEDGRYLRAKTTHNWMLQEHDTGGFGTHNIGFYDFDDPRALQMHDTKDATAAALRTYRGGALVDDQLDDYLLTAESTMPKLPVVVHQMSRASQLTSYVQQKTMLIHARAPSLGRLPATLGWYNQYAGTSASVSEGPRIEAWPDFPRLFTYAAEPFVTSQEWMPAPLHVTSTLPLREVRVYDGRRIIRRFRPTGQREFRHVLHLSTALQQTLIVVAEDEEGHIAVSAARRGRREGGLGVSFCGDHVNHCNSYPLLARGPGTFQLQLHPEMSPDRAGYTWDGGPPGVLPTVRFTPATMVQTGEGREGHRGYNNLPILEMADGQAVVVRSELEEVYDDAIPVMNAWHTWGPIEPSKLLRSVRRFGRYNRPSLGPQASHWSFYARREGAIVAWYSNAITFKRAMEPRRLRIARTKPIDAQPLQLAIRRSDGSEFEARDLSKDEHARRISIGTGDWFGFSTEGVGNDTLFLNRGAPLRMRIKRRGDDRLMIDLDVKLPQGPVAAGETLQVELLSINEALDSPSRGMERHQRLAQYLTAPEGLRILRGTRASERGFLALHSAEGAVEMAVDRPEDPIGITLPVRVQGLNPAWSAGVLQHRGHTPGHYTDGREVYQAVAFDREGLVYAALYPDHAQRTHVTVGHPVVCDNDDVVIEALPAPAEPDADARYAWHVSVHNPTEAPIDTTCRRAMAVPGLDFQRATRTLEPGAVIPLKG